MAYDVEVAPGGAVSNIEPVPAAAPVVLASGGESVSAPMAGHILRIAVKEGQTVASGEIVVVMEAMKMETEVRARNGGTVSQVLVKPGDSVAMHDVLVMLS